MTIKERFNWLAEKPRRNFTLTELFKRDILKRPEDKLNANVLGFTRAGRVVERSITISYGAIPAAFLAGIGLLGGLVVSLPMMAVAGLTAGAVAAAQVVATGFALGAVNLTGAKVVGVVAGKVTDLAVKGLNRFFKPAAAKPQAEPPLLSSVVPQATEAPKL